MATAPRFPSSLDFGSFLVYPSPATTDAARTAKSVIIRIKEDRASHLPSLTLVEYTVRQIRRTLDETGLAEILTDEATFVPMPKSAPLVKDAVWAPRSICISLVQTHFGRDWQPLIERVRMCDKSAYARPGHRPVPTRHYETMRATKSTVAPRAIVMVDDVITMGSTFIGAAARLREIYPDTPIAAFAVARTCNQFTTVKEPCLGGIEASEDGRWSKRHDRVFPQDQR